jgi:hypothetical protein
MAKKSKKARKHVCKAWYQSRTIWFNVLLLILSIVLEITGRMEEGATLSFVAIINIILRAITKTGISWK